MIILNQSPSSSGACRIRIYQHRCVLHGSETRECAARVHDLEDPLVKLPDRDEGAAARGEASGTVLEAVANTGAPPVLHRLERPLHLHPANDEWSLLRALLYDNGRRSEWASRQLHSRHPSDGSVNS